MKIDLDDLARKAAVAESESPWRVYRCDSAEDDAACGIKDEPFVSASEDCYQRGVVHDTNRDECHHHMMRCDAEFIVAAQPIVVLALVARIRELERYLVKAADVFEYTRFAPGVDDLKELRAVLAKGAVSE